MNKKLIAAAVASAVLVPTWALAQSAIPTPAQERARETATSTAAVYGIINGAFQVDQATGATADTAPLNTLIKAPGLSPVNAPSRQRIQSYSSRIGFKGVEDLGNDLKLVFQIESQVNTDGTSGGSLIGAREVKVGFQTKYGELTYGQWLTPYALASIYEDDIILSMGSIHNILGSHGFGAGAVGIGGVSAFLPGAYVGRLPNSVIWQSANWNGFDIRGQYMANETKSATSAAAATNPWIYSSSVAYNGAGFRVSYSYQRSKDQIALGQQQGLNTGYITAATNFALSATHGAVAGTPGLHSSDTASKLSASYTWGGLRVGAIYEQTKFGASGLGAAGLNSFDYKRNAYVLLGVYRTGQHGFTVTFSKATDGTCGGTGLACSAQDLGAQQWAGSYTYALSKRTFLTAVAMRLQNKRAASYTIYNGTGLAAGAGADPQGVMVQIMHLF